MADYTVEMFHEDYEKVIPILLNSQNVGEQSVEAKPENNFQDIISYFIKKYGNSKGTDYQIRFLSVMQFIEHYQKDLMAAGLIFNDKATTQVSNEVLGILLSSFRPPQPPNVYPSSNLFNQDHEFNYKKVLKAATTQAKK